MKKGCWLSQVGGEGRVGESKVPIRNINMLIVVGETRRASVSESS